MGDFKVPKRGIDAPLYPKGTRDGPADLSKINSNNPKFIFKGSNLLMKMGWKNLLLAPRL